MERVDCGAPLKPGVPLSNTNSLCDLIHNLCQGMARRSARGQPLTTVGVFEQTLAGTWRPIGNDCAVAPARQTPRVTPMLAWQQARRLVPHPPIGIAPPGGRSLVNIQTLLWVDTPADQPLGPVTLLGHRVALRIHVQSVDWDFGDGQRDRTGDPGRKYDPRDPCTTVTCPDYWGHVYTTTGTMTVRASVTWSGEFRVDTGGWAPIAGTVTGATQTAALTIRQARGVLVPDPLH